MDTDCAAAFGACLSYFFIYKKFPNTKFLNVFKILDHTHMVFQYFTNWIEKSFSFIPISKYFSLNV